MCSNTAIRINPCSFAPYDGSGPFDIAIAADGTAWVSNSGGLPFGEFPSSVAKYALVNGALQQQFLHFLRRADLGACPSIPRETPGSLLRGTTVVYALRPDGTQIGQGPLTAAASSVPWDTAIDGEDNVWVANFGPLQLGSNFAGRLTKLWGINAAAGSQCGRSNITVRQATRCLRQAAKCYCITAMPLYGHGQPPGPPCFIPMMRQTDVVIDQAGNIWSVNNWKPDFDIDTIGGNPGGDGIIIFVGLAPPPTTQVH